MARRDRKKAPYRNRPVPGFHYVGNRLVPNEGTTWNEKTEQWDIADDTPPEPQPIKKDDASLINGGGDYDQGSEINTALGKNEIGQDMMQTDTYGISGDESTKTTTFSTHFEGVDYAFLTDAQQHQMTLEGSAWTGRGRDEGWIWGDTPVGRIKVNKYGTPWQNPNKTHHDASGAGEHDEEGDNVMEMDDEGRFPDEPGYGKGPDWKPPFQTSGGETDMPTDAEIDFMMNDDNYDTGGNLQEYNAEGDYIGDFDIGLGIGEEGGWTPTKRRMESRRTGRGQPSGDKPQSGNLRRQIRKLSPSLISGPR